MNRTVKFVGLLILLAAIFAIPVWNPNPRMSFGSYFDLNREVITSGSGVAGLYPWLKQASSSALALLQQGREGGDSKLVLGGSYTLSAGDTLSGDLIILGGSANIEEAAVVDGDAVVLGGTLRSSGKITGDVLVLGGMVELGGTAHVLGDVTTISGNLNRDPGALVDGDVNTSTTGPLPLPLPVDPGATPLENGFPSLVANTASSIWSGLFFFFRSFVWAALAVLLVLFVPKQSERVAETVVSNPVASSGLGLLTMLVAPVLVILAAITIIGIPFALLLGLVLGAAWIFGLVALGAEAGKRLAGLLHQNWALPVNAAIGAFLLTIVVNGIQHVVPCIGWLAPVVVGSVGLGAVVLTLFGSREYPRDTKYELSRRAPADFPIEDPQEPPLAPPGQ